MRTLDSPEHGVGASDADFSAGLGNGGQRNGKQPRETDVVETGKEEIAGRTPPDGHGRLEEFARGQVVGANHRPAPATGGQNAANQSAVGWIPVEEFHPASRTVLHAGMTQVRRGGKTGTREENDFLRAAGQEVPSEHRPGMEMVQPDHVATAAVGMLGQVAVEQDDLDPLAEKSRDHGAVAGQAVLARLLRRKDHALDPARRPLAGAPPRGHRRVGASGENRTAAFLEGAGDFGAERFHDFGRTETVDEKADHGVGCGGLRTDETARPAATLDQPECLEIAQRAGHRGTRNLPPATERLLAGQKGTGRARADRNLSVQRVENLPVLGHIRMF